MRSAKEAGTTNMLLQERWNMQCILIVNKIRRYFPPLLSIKIFDIRVYSQVVQRIFVTTDIYNYDGLL